MAEAIKAEGAPRGSGWRRLQVSRPQWPEAAKAAAVFIVGMAILTQLAPTFFLQVGPAAYRRLIGWNHTVANGATVLFVLLTAFVMYRVRVAQRTLYGIVEVVIAAFVAWDAFDLITGTASPLKLAGALYVAVRGFDNYQVGRDAAKKAPTVSLPLTAPGFPILTALIPGLWPLITFQLSKAACFLYFYVVAGLANVHSRAAGLLVYAGMVGWGAFDNRSTRKAGLAAGVPQGFPRSAFADLWPRWRERSAAPGEAAGPTTPGPPRAQ